VECLDGEGRVYFYSTVMGQSRWTPPGADNSTALVSKAAATRDWTPCDDGQGNSEWSARRLEGAVRGGRVAWWGWEGMTMGGSGPRAHT
jgi:hypothetical protein